MLILHAAWIEGGLVLWAEAPADPLPAAGRSRRRGTPSSTARLPYCASAETLLTTVGSVVHGSDEANTGRRLSPIDVVAWLPTVDGRALPSSALIAPLPESDNEPALRPWTVTATRAPVFDLLPTLSSAADAHTLAQGVIVGADLAFWGLACRLAASIVARGRFIPGLQLADASLDPVQQPSRVRSGPSRTGADSAGLAAPMYRAVWQPLLAGDNAERLHALAAQMPHACRALTMTAAGEPGAAGFPLLARFVGDCVDRLVRGCEPDVHLAVTSGRGGKPIGRGRRQSRADSVGAVTAPERRAAAIPAVVPESIHDAWIAALRSPANGLGGEEATLAKFAADIAEWHRPLLSAEAGPFRLCFRLREPEDRDSREQGEDTLSHARTKDATWSVDYLVQPADDPSLLVPARDVWRHGSRARRLLERPGAEPRAFLLQALGQAAAISRRVDATLTVREPDGLSLDTAGAYEFLTADAWTLEQADFGVLLPSWWTRKGARIRLAARARIKSPRPLSATGLSLDELVTVNWEVALGDATLSMAELRALAAAKAPLVEVRGQWVEVTADDRQRAITLLQNRGDRQMRAGDLVRLALGASSGPGELDFAGVSGEGWVRELVDRLDARVALEELPPPPSFSGVLRPYQTRGYSWLAFLRRWELGACLADDMGLGKTVQTLALIAREHHGNGDRPVLLICPTSVVGNWQKEAARFTPDLQVLVHHGHTRERDSAFVRRVSAYGLVISSYALLARDIETLRQVDWSGIVLDEAQNIKNPETRQTKASRALKGGFRIALTGTPVENHIGDLWSIMEFLNPGLLGSLAEFKKRFFVPIQAMRDPAAAEALKRVTGPFILRRLKSDPAIAADLPSKLEMNVFCTLTREQASLYAAVVADMERALKQADGIQRKGVVLATLSKLKQVCNHPAQFLGDKSALSGRSGKLSRLTEMIDEMLQVSDRALVFSQFAEMGHLVRQHLQDTFGVEVPFLHGGVPKVERDRLVDRFQAQAGPPVFVLSLKAGGTGLNLTAANRVFLFDRWWNPAVENQAMDRAFRIGQRRNVQVHKFLCVGTLEERIDEMIERKKKIAAEVVGTGEAWLTELSTEELKQVFALGKEAVTE